jgi:hypothetical protein
MVKAINIAVWDDDVRNAAYLERALAVVRANPVSIALTKGKITRHAEHTEASWRRVLNPRSLVGRERTVFPIDYESVTDRAAGLGMAAMEQIEARVGSGEMADRELVGVAKLGVAAVAEREKSRQRANDPHQTVLAIFGITSGHLVIPPGTVRDVTPLAELEAELESERTALRAHAGYDAEAEAIGALLDN